MVGLCSLIGSRSAFFSGGNIGNVRLVDEANGRALHYLCRDPFYVCKTIGGGVLVRLGQPRGQHKQVDVSRAELISEQPVLLPNRSINHLPKLLEAGGRAPLDARLVLTRSTESIRVIGHLESVLQRTGEKEQPLQKQTPVRISWARGQLDLGVTVAEKNGDSTSLVDRTFFPYQHWDPAIGV